MRKLLCRKNLLSTLLLGACAACALAATWTWTGSAQNSDDWTAAANWSVVGFGACFYPCSTADDVIIPLRPVGGVWGRVDLDFDNTKTIDDMTILDGVDFVGHAGSPPTLKMDIFTIDAGDAAVTVTFARPMTFVANEP